MESGLRILLDHPQGVFYPGNKVTGKISVDVKMEESKSFIGLLFKCNGEGLVFFTDRSAGFRRKFSNEQSYFFQEFYLFGDGDKEVELEYGENLFEFSFELPENIPCSFEGRYGRVRYNISASLEKTKDLRMTETVPFTVAPVLDLNKDSLAPLPISEDNSKVLIGQSEAIRMLVTIPVRGFVPGQTIPVKISLKNESETEIRKLRVVLKKVISYHAVRKSRRHKEIIVEIEIPVTKNCSIYETGVDVPAVPPTGMIFCSVIDVWYTLKVEAFIEVDEWYLKMLQKNLKTRMKIVVGTVPLRNYETPEDEEFKDVCLDAEEGSSKNRKELSTNQSNDNNYDVNSYEESKIYPSSKPNRDDPNGEDEDDQAAESAKVYAPLYRVYTFNKAKKNSAKSRR